MAAGIANVTATKNVLALCRHFVPKYQAECSSYCSSPKTSRKCSRASNSTDTSSNRYDLLPCVEAGGKWYADLAV